jgi:hypothetical protein
MYCNAHDMLVAGTLCFLLLSVTRLQISMTRLQISVTRLAIISVTRLQSL